MSGHSKWANIKHKKGKADAERGKVFTKLGREIAIAVRSGGPDPNANARLKDIIAKAKANNVPNDNIARSIKKAAGETGSDNYEEILYEGYGPGGVAVIVETLTDNRNRTAGDVRHVFDKYGGNLGTNGCVSFMFDKRGQFIIEKTKDFDRDLKNIFVLILVNPERVPSVKLDDARLFARWLQGKEGQGLISSFGRETFGTSLFSGVS